MAKQPLTSMQDSVLEYLIWYIETNGIPPTVRDICENFDIASPNGVAGHLEALERKGWIERFPGRSRGIKIVGDNADFKVALQRLVAAVDSSGQVDARVLAETRGFLREHE